MRLIYKDKHLTAQFTVPWEVTYLTQHPDQWVPLYLIGEKEPLGAIHSTTQEVRLSEGSTVAHRQVVVLGPEMP